jgi:DNA topoisomerase-3
LKVELTLLVNGHRVVLSKEYFENWVKDRTTKEVVLKGHTVKYFVNEADKTSSEYVQIINSILDEKKLFDVIARAYLASVMPDFRYRQTTATLDVAGFPFKATGRQPIDLGWRAAFPEWTPADEKGDEAQLLPVMKNGETARLQEPVVEDKETRPPPRYNEGTLIEAMQNAWRFVDDEILRDRLKEAKGIGTPATRAEIIGGLKRQDFLMAQGKNIVPTETGLRLFGVLREADPALVDPGLTAQLECLLDDVVIGKQEMVGAIDAVCDVAERIIGKLRNGAHGGGAPLRGGDGSGGSRPPTPAMKRYALTLARQKRVKLPADYATSGAVCRAFLEEHAPKKSANPVNDEPSSATREPEGGAIRKPTPPGKSRARRGAKPVPLMAEGAGDQPQRKRKAKAGAAPAKRAQSNQLQTTANGGTPLRIPYGNKETAQKLGARYAAGGWYAPPGVDLSAFSAQGWL